MTDVGCNNTGPLIKYRQQQPSLNKPEHVANQELNQETKYFALLNFAAPLLFWYRGGQKSKGPNNKFYHLEWTKINFCWKFSSREWGRLEGITAKTKKEKETPQTKTAKSPQVSTNMKHGGWYILVKIQYFFFSLFLPPPEGRYWPKCLSLDKKKNRKSTSKPWTPIST